MGTRETQRRAWREAVARAAEEWAYERVYGDGYDALQCWSALDHALRAPKPWTRPAKADLGGWMRRTKCGVDDTEPCWACLDEAGEALRRKRRAAQRRRR